MYRFAVVQAVLVGSESEARPLIEGSLARFEHPAVVKALGEPRAKALYCGYLFTLRLLDCYCFGDRALVGAREVEATGVMAWVVSADQLQLLYHSFRGEANERRPTSSATSRTSFKERSSGATRCSGRRCS